MILLRNNMILASYYFSFYASPIQRYTDGTDRSYKMILETVLPVIEMSMKIYILSQAVSTSRICLANIKLLAFPLVT